ncbi:MAG: ATP-binding protein [Candidatus Bathyarchaeia archaeon]
MKLNRRISIHEAINVNLIKEIVDSQKKVVFFNAMDQNDAISLLRLSLHHYEQSSPNIDYYIDKEYLWFSPEIEKKVVDVGLKPQVCLNEGRIIHEKVKTQLTFNNMPSVFQELMRKSLSILKGIVALELNPKLDLENLPQARGALINTLWTSADRKLTMVLIGRIPDELKPLTLSIDLESPGIADYKRILKVDDEVSNALLGLTMTEAAYVTHMTKDPEEIRMAKVAFLKGKGINVFTPRVKPEYIGGRFKTRKRIFGDQRTPGFIDMILRYEGGGDPPNKILFMGNRGMGRTFFAEAVASKFPIASEMILSRFLSKYLGESEAKLRNYLLSLTSLRPIPVVIVIRELDVLGEGGGEGSTGEVMQNLLVELLDFIRNNPDISIVATCVDPEKINPTLRNTFNVREALPHINNEEREDILNVLFKRFGINLDVDVVLKNIPLIEKLERPRELSDLVRYSVAIARFEGTRVSIDIMRRASDLIRPSPLSEREIQIERKILSYVS